MKFKLPTLPKQKIKNLSQKLREEIQFIQDNTENFDDLYYEAFQENDERLYKLAETELKEIDAEEKATKEEKKEQTTKEIKASKEQKSATTRPNSEAKNTVSKNENLLITNPKVTKLKVNKQAEKFDLSFRKKVSTEMIEAAKKVQFNCQFNAITAEKDMLIEIMSKVKKGDKILIHEDGYPFAVMNKSSFTKRCVNVKAEKTEDPVQEEVKEIPPAPEDKKPRDQKEKTSADKEPTPKKPTPDKCNINALTENPQAPLLTWLNGQIELWKSRQTNQKISKIMAIKETGEIIIEFTHYDKLLRIADLRLSYFSICLESTKLSKATPQKRGTYRLLVSKADLKNEYSTKRNWNTCRTWIREAYQCARAGNCTASQKELFKKFYYQCGDQVAKQEDIAYLRWLHQKAGEQWQKRKETYLEAFKRVVVKLKASST